MLNNLLYRNPLYLGESIDSKKLDKLIRKLEKHPCFSGLFLITLSRNFTDQLDIFDAKLFGQKYYQTVPFQVVGLAKSHGEAISLVEAIAKDCYERRGDGKLKEYLTWEP